MSRARKKSPPSRSVQPGVSQIGSILAAWAPLARVGIIIIVGLLMLWLSWRKWLEPIIDFGRELYIPWQLSVGEVLYRDIAYFNGPVSPYFNALLFKTFGVGLMTIAWANIAILVGVTFLIHRLLCIVGSRLSAMLGCVFFLVIFALAQLLNTANYNFVCPYSHELTHGFALSLLAIYLLYRYLDSSKAVFVGLVGVCLGLILLTKVEVFAAAALAMAVGSVLILWTERPVGLRILKLLGLFVGGTTLPLLCFGVYFAMHMPLGQAFHSIFIAYGGLFSSDITAQKFYRVAMGIDQPGENLLLMLKVTGWYLLLLGPLAVADYFLRRFSARRKYLGPVAFVLGLGLSAWLFRFVDWSSRSAIMPEFMRDLAYPLPLFMVIMAGVLLVLMIRCKDDVTRRNRYGLALVLSIFSLMMLFKIILNVRAYHYGFVLAAPATLLLIVALVHWLPHLLAGDSKQGGLVFKPVILAVLIVVLAGYFNNSRRRYALKTYPLGKGSDAFMMHPWPKGPALRQALEYMDFRMEPGETFVIFPEGIMLNYLSRRPNPTTHISFMPAESALFGEDAMLDGLLQDPPDHVLVVPRSLAEYGFKAFGKDYCMKLSRWTNRNYGNPQLIGQSVDRNSKKPAYVVYCVSRISELPPASPP